VEQDAWLGTVTAKAALLLTGKLQPAVLQVVALLVAGLTPEVARVTVCAVVKGTDTVVLPVPPAAMLKGTLVPAPVLLPVQARLPVIAVPVTLVLQSALAQAVMVTLVGVQVLAGLL